MDADGIYPKGFHPATETMDASGYKPAKPKRRRDAQGLRYYFIDFGISSIFGPDDDRRVVGVDGQDNEVPELSMDVPYDPFLTDVFIIGNLFQKVFLDVRIPLRSQLCPPDTFQEIQESRISRETG